MLGIITSSVNFSLSSCQLATWGSRIHCLMLEVCFFDANNNGHPHALVLTLLPVMLQRIMSIAGTVYTELGDEQVE